MSRTAILGGMWAPIPVRELTDTLWRQGWTRRPFVTDEPTYACGQALDCSHTAHWPRCGVTLHS